jgi:multidrug efflux pump subunit AcrB
MAHLSDHEQIESTHNSSRFFVEHPPIAWLLVVLIVLWGVFAYYSMPQRKDPKTAVREAMVVTNWPGARAEQVEELVTKKVEAVLGQNDMVSEIRSSSREGQSVVTFELDEFHVKNTAKEFDDIGIKLAQIADLPDGAGPVQYIKDFGETSALMLTVASPPVPDTEISLRARQIEPLIERSRQASVRHSTPVSIVICFPDSLDTTDLRDLVQILSAYLLEKHAFSSLQTISDQGVILLDGTSEQSDAVISQTLHEFLRQRVQSDQLDPDIWPPVIVRNPADLEAKLRQASPSKYTYRELDTYTGQIARSLENVDQVTRVDRTGNPEERLFLTFDPSRLASLHVSPLALSQLLRGRNMVDSGGEVNSGSRRVAVLPGGVFHNIADLLNVPVPMPNGHAPEYLRDMVSIRPGYESPPSFLNFLTYRDASGQWRRGRAVTISMEMRPGRKIEDFSRAVDTDLGEIRHVVPSDLVIDRTSDQPRQVQENISLFTTSLWEAIGLVVLVSLVGFRDWRSAALTAAAIPITLAMTTGMMAAAGIDLQQVSIASLIIALGLLVDDPVVAGDAIQRELQSGHPAAIAGWLGPTKLGRAILYATVTNILAYLPFLLLHGDTGQFIFSLPVVITCSLVASRIVSMTFVPFMGQMLLRKKSENPINANGKPRQRVARIFHRMIPWAIQHRKTVLAGSLLFLLFGSVLVSRLSSAFFPYDLQYLSYADIWLPEGATFAETNAVSQQVEQIIQQVSAKYAKDSHRGKPVVKSLTTFVGGGGPRFWESVSPEARQLNYAEVMIETTDKRDTSALVSLIQAEISRRIAGARVDVRQLETGPPIAAPVSIRILGPDVETLRMLSARLQSILHAIPSATRIRDDWGENRIAVDLKIDPDRAAINAVTNQDVAQSSMMNTSGLTVGTFYDQDKSVPIVLRQRLGDRAAVSDIQDQYVYSTQGGQPVPLKAVAEATLSSQVAVIRHFNRSRAITVSCYPIAGMLASTVLDAAMPQIQEMISHLPPGYSLVFAGEYKAQHSGFADLAIALSVSVLAIYLALMFQFRNIVKPLIVFSAIPFGCIGAFAALYVTGQPFGFMAFLGIASLMGVIVSHIIVLFDAIEEHREQGEDLMQALVNAAVLRLRPVLITVGATAFALVPLALHGGPLWEPLCYAQMGGLLLSAIVTLLLVPTIYAFVVLDLRWFTWKAQSSATSQLAALSSPSGSFALAIHSPGKQGAHG